ncbi:dihydroxyacetone kinase subunit L [Rhizobium sp. Root708]|uniref:dihydroxyacetone kinase subunit L n=1 Tax=Rhizobium sp. Root708 TaxID=1736592 RepID=UPI00138EFBD7|nr:dihydroxyacetone kinase subunit L [Rhizobium sp. Root708]
MEATLNAADSRLGDGDTGTMLARLLTAIEQAEPVQDDIGATFKVMAMKAAQSTGSSLGTLISASLLSAGSRFSSSPALSVADIGTIVKVARDEMLSLGRSQLGDKTIVDGLDALACALENGSNPCKAVDEALSRFRGKPCKVGRARMWPEQSMDLDDPGMLALAGIVKAIYIPSSQRG